MIAPQDSQESLYDEFSAQLLEDALTELHPKVWRGYAKPDTLRPGECYIMPFPEDSVPKKVIDTDLKGIVSNNYFTERNPDLPTDQPYRTVGEAGDPVPYTVRADNTLTILLLLCFVFFVVSLAHSKHFLAKQLKDFFWPASNDRDNNESGGELRFMVFLSMVNALVLAISTYLVASNAIDQKVIESTGLMLIAILFAAFTAYYCVKWMVTSIVNLTFFGGKKTLQWMTVQLQVTALQGVLLFPILALQIYFDFSAENALLYLALVLFLNKILTFCKSFQIFFKGNGLYLQTFLYFCSLEIAPMLALGGAGLAIIDTIKINF